MSSSNAVTINALMENFSNIFNQRERNNNLTINGRIYKCVPISLAENSTPVIIWSLTFADQLNIWHVYAYILHITIVQVMQSDDSYGQSENKEKHYVTQETKWLSICLFSKRRMNTNQESEMMEHNICVEWIIRMAIRDKRQAFVSIYDTLDHTHTHTHMWSNTIDCLSHKYAYIYYIT